jgi:hypothetical protein
VPKFPRDKLDFCVAAVANLLGISLDVSLLSVFDCHLQQALNAPWQSADPTRTYPDKPDASSLSR